MTITAGIDVGTGCVKAVLFEVGRGESRWLARSVERIRQRDPYQLAEEAYESVLREAGVPRAKWRTSPRPGMASTSSSRPATSTR